MNCKPITWLGVATVLIFSARMLTVWFYMRRLREGVGDEADTKKTDELFSLQKPVVPVAVSSFYFLSGVAFIATSFWGTFCTAWWVIILAVLVWIIIHLPFRDVMLSWSQTQTVSMIMQDTDALLKRDLSPEQAKAIKKRLGIDK